MGPQPRTLLGRTIWSVTRYPHEPASRRKILDQERSHCLFVLRSVAMQLKWRHYGARRPAQQRRRRQRRRQGRRQRGRLAARPLRAKGWRVQPQFLILAPQLRNLRISIIELRFHAPQPRNFCFFVIELRFHRCHLQLHCQDGW